MGHYLSQRWFLCEKEWGLILAGKGASGKETKSGRSSFCLWIEEQEHYPCFAVYSQAVWSCGLLHWNRTGYFMDNEYQQKECRFRYT